MKIYYEKQKFLVSFLKFLAVLTFLSTAALITITLMKPEYIFDIDYIEYQYIFEISAIISAVLFIFFVVIRMIIKRRKNIRFDGSTIQFCINNYVESEFDLKKLDELFKYRNTPNIKYGYQDALAFRFHKNDVWESIDSTYTNHKTRDKSNVLINDINQTYARIKAHRVIQQISPSQGVRFRYLVLEDNKASDEDYDNALKEFESTFSKYTNTYGGFNLDRLVITSDSLYYNRDKIASSQNICFVSVNKINKDNKNYLSSEKLNFINKDNELIISIDTTRVVNNELFKNLVLSIFTQKDVDESDIIIREDNTNNISLQDNNDVDKQEYDPIQNDRNIEMIEDEELVNENQNTQKNEEINFSKDIEDNENKVKRKRKRRSMR